MGKGPGQSASTNRPRFSSEEARPASWSSAEMPGGTPAALTVTSVPSDAGSSDQVMTIVPAKAGSAEFELHDLDDPPAGDELEKAPRSDVGPLGGLARDSLRLAVQRQLDPVRAALPRLELQDPSAHALRRQPGDERFGIDEGAI